MLKLIPQSTIVLVVAALALVAEDLLGLALGGVRSMGGPDLSAPVGLSGIRLIAAGVWLLFALLAIPAIWQGFWRIPVVGSWLENAVFPDLSGRWRVRIRSNHPIREEMRLAAADAARPRFDPAGGASALPDLLVVEFEGTLTQGWLRSDFHIESDESSSLRDSHTHVLEFLRSQTPPRKSVIWTFEQFNNGHVASDQDSFMGSARLRVESKDRLEGEYWNNRSWRIVGNAAGKITLERLPDKRRRGSKLGKQRRT